MLQETQEMRTKSDASKEEARAWIESWRGNQAGNGASGKHMDEAKEEVSKEKSRGSANI